MRKMLIIILTASSAVFGSGFKCESPDGLRVKLFNNVESTAGTRTPAALVISGDLDGTLLVRTGTSISKRIRAHSVQYTVQGTSRLGASAAILQIPFREGRETLSAGETIGGQLILLFEDGDKEVVTLECVRYLKTR